MKPIRIIVFAKAPVSGFAKTRLIPALGPDGAAGLARCMLDHTLRAAGAAALGPVELCVTPSPCNPVWRRMTVPPGTLWSDQGDGDLGQRLSRASARAGGPAILVGTDCPALDAAMLQRIADCLTRNDAVLLPTLDGGYAALGLNRHHPRLFEDIAWSTDSVAAATVDRLRELDWSYELLPSVSDVDEPGDLQYLPAAWRGAAGL